MNERRRPTKNRDLFQAEDDLRPTIPLPADTLIDQDAEISGQKRLQHWLDEAVADYEKRGGFERLPGKGKPLVVPTGDIMTTIMKNANVTHPWLMLRELIQEAMEDTLRLLERTPESPIIDEQISSINKNIIQLNHDAPSLSLHRRRITRDNLREQYDKWK